MAHIKELKAAFCLEILVVFDVGCEVHIGLGTLGIAYQKGP